MMNSDYRYNRERACKLEKYLIPDCAGDYLRSQDIAEKSHLALKLSQLHLEYQERQSYLSQQQVKRRNLGSEGVAPADWHKEQETGLRVDTKVLNDTRNNSLQSPVSDITQTFYHILRTESQEAI